MGSFPQARLQLLMGMGAQTLPLRKLFLLSNPNLSLRTKPILFDSPPRAHFCPGPCGSSEKSRPWGRGGGGGLIPLVFVSASPSLSISIQGGLSPLLRWLSPRQFLYIPTSVVQLKLRELVFILVKIKSLQSVEKSIGFSGRVAFTFHEGACVLF